MIASAGWSSGESYISAVLNGEVTVPKTIRGVVERHVSDLKKERTEEFPFYFDVNAASTIIDCYPILFRHSKGEFAGDPFILQPWQSFGLGLIFGWKRLDDASRRFRELLWQMARKNGKSAVLSSLAIILGGFDLNPLVGKPEPVAEVVLAAQKKEQALQVAMSEIERMRIKSPVISDLSEVSYRQVRFHHNEGQILAVGSDRPFDGLNPSAVLADEYHAWGKHQQKFWDTMVTGSGARVQSLTGVFTTSGNSASTMWRALDKRCRDVALGNTEDDELLPLIYELDSPDELFDEDSWIKANPNLGISIKLDYLRSQARKAKTSEQQKQQFARYHGNIQVNASTKAIDLEAWDACGGDLSDWSTSTGIGAGVDIGGRDDLAAFALCARFDTDELDDDGEPIPRFEFQVWAYLASNCERDVEAEPWASWIAAGKVQFCRFPISQMKTDLLAALTEFGVDSTAYDPAGGQQFAENIEAEGFKIASMAQTYRHFNEPIGELLAAVSEGRVTHNGCDFYRWTISNAVTVADRQQRLMFDKRESGDDKIDPVVASVMALARAMKAPRPVSGPLFMT